MHAIEHVPYGTSMTLAVVLEATATSSWRDVLFMPTFDCPFQCVIQPQVGPDFGDRSRSVLVLYQQRHRYEAWTEREQQLIGRRWLERLFGVFPDARSHVIDTHFTNWRDCFPYLRADRGAFLEAVQMPVEEMHFAGDYTSESSGTHGAIGSGDRVAREIMIAAGASSPERSGELRHVL
jgi:protoporphyrinogen oxidase